MATERLPPVNLIIRDTLRGRIPSSDKAGQPVALSLTEFDDVRYLMLLDPSSPDLFQLSMAVPSDPSGTEGAKALPDGAIEAVAQTYAAYATVAPTPSEGYSITLNISLSKLPTEADPLEIELEKVASIRSVIMGMQLRKILSAMASASVMSDELHEIRYRPNMSYYARRSDADAVTVIFPMHFNDSGDAVIARTFLAQFQEARRAQQMNTAPACSYSLAAPLELKGVSGVAANGGYISFVVFKRHVTTPKRLESAVWSLGTFYAFVGFHIKCSKAFMHTSMRKRAGSLLQVLNRAKPDVEKEKKTASGRAFTRKV